MARKLKKTTKKKAVRGRKRKATTVWNDVERAAWELPPDISVSEWAGQHRIIGDYSAEPGPWRNDRAPYLVGIMDAYGDVIVEEITIAGPAQSGKTESVFNMMAYTVDCDPVPTMYVGARDKDVEDISTDRIYPMFTDSPQLAKHLPGSLREFKKGDEIEFDRMKLYFAAAQSAAGLASKPIGKIVLDETDKYPDTIGAEGSPAKLAKRRTTTYSDTKVVNLCTPTTDEGYISVSYNKSNMCVYLVPCPCCGEYIRLVFGQLKVDPPDLRDGDIIVETECVYYECQKCSGRIRESSKPDMLLDGVWCPAGCKVDKDGNITGKPKRSKRHSGFWIDGMISPWLGWAKMMAEWFEINDTKGGDIGALREFKNQVLGQVWKEKAKEVDYERLLEKKNDLLRRAVPVECLCLTAGGDYHEDEAGNIRIDYEIRAHAAGMRNFVISEGSVDSWEMLEEETIMHSFPWADGDCEKEELAVIAIFVDSGYHPDEVYEWCRKWPGIAWPTKGQQNQRTPLVVTDLDKVLEKASNPGRRRKAARYRGMQLINIDTNYFKTLVTSQAERAKGETNSTEFYSECGDLYFKEFCNEHQVKKTRSGITKLVWEPKFKGAPTHSLDIAVGASAAGYWKKVHLIGVERQTHRSAAAAKNRQNTQKKKPRAARRGGFLGNLPEIRT